MTFGEEDDCLRGRDEVGGKRLVVQGGTLSALSYTVVADRSSSVMMFDREEALELEANETDVKSGKAEHLYKQCLQWRNESDARWCTVRPAHRECVKQAPIGKATHG